MRWRTANKRRKFRAGFQQFKRSKRAREIEADIDELFAVARECFDEHLRICRRLDSEPLERRMNARLN